MYDSLLCSDGLKTWKLIFSPYIVGMAMDEETARQDVASLHTLLEATAPKGKKSSKHKEKPDEERITFENLEQYHSSCCSQPESCGGIGSMPCTKHAVASRHSL